MINNYLDPNSLRNQFSEYLKKTYPNLKDISVICSNAYFPLRHPIGIEFWEIFKTEESLQKTKSLLEIEFATKNRKNPKSDASTYISSLRYYKEFLGSLENIEINPQPYGTQVYDNERSKKLMAHELDIPNPSKTEVEKYQKKWISLESYSIQEKALETLFTMFPNNSCVEEVLLKVSTLNDFYSTNIFSTFQVAKHIVKLNIDDNLQKGEISLVSKIANMQIDENKVKTFYSFATKYCSHHQSLKYPIYDSYVDRVLRFFRDRDGFFSFKNQDLKIYESFYMTILSFQKFYDLQEYSFKVIDEYLWLLGKDYFQKKY